MKRMFQYGGIAASTILIAFGIASIAVGFSGRHTVRHNLAAEQIVGTPDMTPQAIAGEAKAAGLKNVELPSCSVAGKQVDTGSNARCFAQYIRVHALEATGGLVYSQMGRFLDKNGKQTSDEKLAAVDPKTHKPVENGARNLWVTATALTTALNTSYFAENVALFSVIMGLALLLTGIGFLVVSLGPLRRMAEEESKRTAPAPTATVVPSH